MISIALRYSPADMYISAAALGSLIFRAQSACLEIRFFWSAASPEPTNSYNINQIYDAIICTACVWFSVSTKTFII